MKVAITVSKNIQPYVKYKSLLCVKVRYRANAMEAALRALDFTVDKVLNGNLNQRENKIRLQIENDVYGLSEQQSAEKAFTIDLTRNQRQRFYVWKNSL